jgi:signal transduction histidine kinase
VDQVRDAARLIEQILDFGRRTIMQRDAYDAAEIVENVIAILKRTLPSNITIEFRSEPGEFVLDADKSRLQQAFINLAVNARDAMPEGGKLIFLLARAGAPESLKTELAAGSPAWVTIQMSDNGHGIPPDVLPHIFEPFFTTKEADKGTGLGLAQVYGIVKQHGGEITVESERGKGTTFKLYFPTILREPVQYISQSEGETLFGKDVQKDSTSL